MFRAGLIVDLHDGLAIIDWVPLAVCNFAARIIRLRKDRGEFDGCGTELAGSDSVIHKRSLERDGPSRVTCGGSERRKVAGKHCSGRNETAKIRWILPDRCALVA